MPLGFFKVGFLGSRHIINLYLANSRMQLGNKTAKKNGKITPPTTMIRCCAWCRWQDAWTWWPGTWWWSSRAAGPPYTHDGTCQHKRALYLQYMLSTDRERYFAVMLVLLCSSIAEPETPLWRQLCWWIMKLKSPRLNWLTFSNLLYFCTNFYRPQVLPV